MKEFFDLLLMLEDISNFGGLETFAVVAYPCTVVSIVLWSLLCSWCSLLSKVF
jgi:hypothetical protein